MRKTLTALSVVAGLMFAGAPNAAETTAAVTNYPEKPIRFMVGFPPGGSTDIVARIIAPPLSERLGQQVVLDHRAGAGGMVAVGAIANARPDGYTTGFGIAGALTANVTLLPDLPYDPLKDLAPVSMVVTSPLVFAVNSDLGIDTLKEFIDLAKKKPGEFTYGTSGPGTAMNLAGELLKMQAGFDMRHVPYKGASPAMTDLLAGHITAGFIEVATIKPHLESGRLKALAVTSPQRAALKPEIPTIAEAAGLDGYEVMAWFGVIMPAGTPQPIVAKFQTALDSVLRDPKVSQQLLDAGLEPAPTTPEVFRARIESEIKKYRDIIRAAGITR